MTNILECRELQKRYGAGLALRDVTLSVPAGKVIGLLGPNGSGKTTLIKIVAGLLQPTAGTVLVGGEPIGAQSKAQVAYLPERNSIPLHFTVQRAVEFYETFFPDFDRERALEMLKRLGIPPEKRIKTLSKGTKEKVQLILVMARRAKLFLLDEPISGVDPAAREYVLETVLTQKPEDATILISTHLIADIEPVMDGFVFLHEGKITASGTPEGVRQNTGKTVDEYFREVFRC